jgi:hypothetical protein
MRRDNGVLQQFGTPIGGPQNGVPKKSTASNVGFFSCRY